MARREGDEASHDPTRRDFFRTFGQETVRQAGAVMGAAAELRRASGAAARTLLDLGAIPEPVEVRDPVRDEAEATFSSAYRLSDDAMLILDQRDLPGRMSILTCHEPTEIASAIRGGAISAGPVLAEVAAYSLVLALRVAEGRPAQSRDQVFRSAANTLAAARTDVHALGWAIARMTDRYDELTADDPAPADLTASLRAEADAIASEAALNHAALGRTGAEAISMHATRSEQDRPINLLMHGDMGPLSCGLVGTGTSILQALMVAGRTVHVWVTEAAPGTEGARIASFQLTQLDVPHTVIADAAVGWLLASRPVDGALLRGDWVAANRDTAALIGSLNVAHLSAAAGVPVYVCAPRSAMDPQMLDGSGFVVDLRSPAEVTDATVGAQGATRPAVFGVRLNPTTDVVRSALITALFTETGIC